MWSISALFSCASPFIVFLCCGVQKHPHPHMGVCAHPRVGRIVLLCLEVGQLDVIKISNERF